MILLTTKLGYHISLIWILDTAKTSKGFLSLKAYRLTPMAIQLYKAGDFSAESIKDLKVTHDNLFQVKKLIICSKSLNEIVFHDNRKTI